MEQIMEVLIAEENIWQIIIMVFGAGLITGGMIFLTSFVIGNALKIFKNV